MSKADTHAQNDYIDTRRIRLRTLVNLRWIAIFGQTVTILVASFILQLRIDIGMCMVAVGCAMLVNFLSTSIASPNLRLGPTSALMFLIFDLGQLLFLLFLTGGLHNPFTLLIVVPVTVSASALPLFSTFILGTIGTAAVGMLAVFHVPLRTQEGFVVEMPELHLMGFGCAIVVGTLFLGIYAYRISFERRSLSEALFATQTALAREQKLTDLGGVVAAYAHEMGTPLSTIMLVSTELAEDLSDHSDPMLREDALLVREQAARCSEILSSMGKAGKDDRHMHSAPLLALLKEAAGPHAQRGIDITYELLSGPDAPDVFRKPELIHGLRNMIQNAVDFAQRQVWIDAEWSAHHLEVRITDDGEGYPPELIRRIGDPFLRSKGQKRTKNREGYKGMGLGLFIAKTLLERTGAAVGFSNGSDPFLHPSERGERPGAVVTLRWKKQAGLIAETENTEGLGENVLNEAE